jgi:hypothetical protein
VCAHPLYGLLCIALVVFAAQLRWADLTHNQQGDLHSRYQRVTTDDLQRHGVVSSNPLRT